MNDLAIIHYVGLLQSAKELLSELDQPVFELNTTGAQLQERISGISMNLYGAQERSAAVEMLSAMSAALLTRASRHLQFSNNTHQKALHVLNEVSFLNEGVKRVNDTLEEANRIMKEGKVLQAHAGGLEEVCSLKWK